MMIYFKKILPKSLASRTSIFLLVVILSAEFIAGFIWFQQNESKDQKGLVRVVNSLGLSASTTVSYFGDLPLEYRQLAIDQLRNMGGTRFFISLNSHLVKTFPIEDSGRKTLVLNELKKTIKNELGDKKFHIEITSRSDLLVLDSEVKFDELPNKWKVSSLLYKELNPPIIVIQAELSKGEWFYLAAILPEPYVLITNSFITEKQFLFMGISALIILYLTWFVVHKEIKPIGNLAKAALEMDGKLTVSDVKEEGSEEIRAAINAFNKMNKRMSSYSLERDVLFSSISHDLQTPLACLRLRTEMLDDPRVKQKFEKLLNDMEFMVKGALHCIKNTGIKEDLENIDMNKLIGSCCELYLQSKINVTSDKNTNFLGKPVALKRCIQNIINNAMKYADELEINISNKQDHLLISFVDNGPGIPKKLMEKVFEPYFRCNKKDGLSGSGLGLTIARNIARIHRGDIVLNNAQTTGLEVKLILYRD